MQPRDTCYIASPGLTELSYSGYQPHAYSWDDYSPLQDILDAVRVILIQNCSSSILLIIKMLILIYLTNGFLLFSLCLWMLLNIFYLLLKVHKALPGSSFNSLLLNRYKGGNDYVGWHADDEKLYGATPEIASVSFGCERDFILKKKPCKKSSGMISSLLIVIQSRLHFNHATLFCVFFFISSLL